MECQVGPLKANDAVLLARYATFFSSSDLDVLPVSPAAFDRVVPGSSGDTLPNFSELGMVSLRQVSFGKEEET